MRENRYLLIALLIALPCTGQIRTRQNVDAVLGFENGTPGSYPAGWSGNFADALIDNQVFHGGRYSARIERATSSSGTFTWLFTTIPLDFSGTTIQLSGWVKTEDVSESVAILVREDGDSPSLAFATTQGLGVKGTNDWRQFSVNVPVLQGGRILYFAGLLSGTGKAWFDDFQVLVDGRPLIQAPARVPTVFDTDKEFDGGSRISLTELSNAQVKRLAVLAKVWGFLKYHHPAIGGGTRHWDYDLFRVLPQILSAADTTSSNKAITTWVASLGSVANCTSCATLKSDNLYLAPNLDWIKDETLLGAELSAAIQKIYVNRMNAPRQFFISLAPGVLNPTFENEPAYGAIRLPDAGYQLLGLFRFWNMVEFFYPNRDIIADEPDDAYWNNVLEDFIPRIGLARTSLEYQQEIMQFIAKINDTHANLWSSIAARPPIGTCQLPVDLRFVEGKPIVLRHTSATAGPASGLLPGDIIEQLDGVSVDDLISSWRPFYADSNDAARYRDIANYMTRGVCGPANVMVNRGDETVDVLSSRVAINTLSFARASVHDLPGDTFQMLSPDIAYLKLSSVVAAQSASYIESAAGTKGLIIDIRNYPSEFVVFTLGSRLVTEPTTFVRFTNGDLSNPGAFVWNGSATLVPAKPTYAGKVVILVDEVSQSQAEYTTMAFRSAPGAIVIGSTTAGADGNVSTIPIPGGLSSYISGIGVFYPDGRPTQRVGILSDIEVKPTIQGIREGRDELIEEAIRQIQQDARAQ